MPGLITLASLFIYTIERERKMSEFPISISCLIDFSMNVNDWATAKGLVANSTTERQFLKLVEEYGELCQAEIRGDVDDARDAIGDCYVVVGVICALESIGFHGVADSEYELHGDSLCPSRLGAAIGDLASHLARSGNYSPNENNLLIRRCLVSICRCLAISSVSYIGSVMIANCPEDCMNQAWGVIANRTGKTVDGVFIKDEEK